MYADMDREQNQSGSNLRRCIRARFQRSVHPGVRVARDRRDQHTARFALSVDELDSAFGNPVQTHVSVCSIRRSGPKGEYSLIKRDAYERAGSVWDEGHTKQRGCRKRTSRRASATKKPASMLVLGFGKPPAPGALGVGVCAAMAVASAWVKTLCVHTNSIHQ